MGHQQRQTTDIYIRPTIEKMVAEVERMHEMVYFGRGGEEVQ